MSDPLYDALRRWFGFRTFRPGQERVVRALLEGRDALVVMPTGSGKSLCFQLPALMMPGTTIVVSPLIALMKDQVDALSARRIPATFLNSSLAKSEIAHRLASLRMGSYKLVYVAPERFRNPRFLDALRQTPLSMLAIDEAHCISAWGHDFRPDYLHLGDCIAQLPASVRILAVTATATEDVRRDIARHLRLGTAPRSAPETLVAGFARPNLALHVSRVRTHAEKLERLLQVIEFFRTGIVYCSTRRTVEMVRDRLAQHGIRALAYSGAMEDRERTRVQDAFMNGTSAVVIATNAFGMGVDRQDIRFVVHWDVPGSLEAYYQEVGRAGRDGAFAWCELLFNYADVRTQEFFLAAANPPAEQVYELYAAIRNACSHDPHGEACLSPEAWAECAGIKAPLSVRNLIALFERHGLCSGTRRIGSPDDVLTVPETCNDATLRSICAELRQKEVADRARLGTMLDFVNTPHCRHRFLLAYFGEPSPSAPCARCDRCAPLTAFPPRLAPDPDRLTRLKMVLSCVARMQGRGDYALAASILRGEAPEPWRTLSTFGLLPDFPAQALVRECEALELDGYLAGMTLTPAGRDLATGRGEVAPIALLPDPDALPKPAKTSPRSATTPAQGLAAALRKWVKAEAARRDLPPYMILKNQTLATLAKRRPTTEAELALIPGMGEVKIAKYGNALLDLISAYEP